MGHAVKRAKERYGLDLTVADLKEITRRIWNNDGTVLEKHFRDTTGTSIWRLVYRDIPIRIIMSRDLYCVVTFLPLHKPNRTRRWKRYFRRRKGRLRSNWA